jgi:glycosyltransferase involved in cell wall biosynthesis
LATEEQYGRPRIKRKPLSVEKPAEESKPESSVEAKDSGHDEKKDKTITPVTRKEKIGKPPFRKEGTARPSMRTGEVRKDRKYRPAKSTRPDKKSRYEKRAKSERFTKQRKTAPLKLSVVIPAFNEEDNISPLLEQFNNLFSNLPYRAEMILVNDGSTDKTLIRAKEGQLHYPWLRVYNHRSNCGLTMALMTGFSKASGKVICFYPADLQYHADEIPRMISRIDSGADIVTGWKKGGYGLKSIGSFIYNLLSRLLFRIKVHDLNSIKAFKKEVTECFTYRRGWHRYMIVMAAQYGYTVDEVKVKLYPRRSGKTKFGFWRLPLGFLDLLSVKFQLSFTKKPLLFFGSAGLISIILGFVIGLVTIYLRVIAHAGFRPLLYLVILLVVSGLLLFTIGFLAELIVSVKEDINRRKGNFVI